MIEPILLKELFLVATRQSASLARLGLTWSEWIPSFQTILMAHAIPLASQAILESLELMRFGTYLFWLWKNAQCDVVRAIATSYKHTSDCCCMNASASCLHGLQLVAASQDRCSS